MDLDSMAAATSTTVLDALACYPFRGTPFAHQMAALRASVNKRAFALFMEPGTGKTKITLDTAAILFLRGHIRGLLVVAPNDVHAQWVEEQIPEHLPDIVSRRVLVWEASRSSIKKRLTELLRPLPHTLHVLTMNHEALATQNGRKAAKAFLRTYPSLFVLDESHGFKNPSAARTRAAVSLAPLAFARRILTGTETDGNPFDLYSQFNFLDPRILGFDSFLAFKHRYGVWSRQMAMTRPSDPSKQPRKVEYETLETYANLEELVERVRPYTFRARKRECVDLPPKHYVRLPTHLSDIQRTIYNTLLEEGLLLIQRAQNGEVVDVRSVEEMEDSELLARVDSPEDRMTLTIKLTLQLRLQQCVGGFVTDDNGRTTMLGSTWETVPRAVTAVDHVRQALANGEGKVIVWSVFRAELLMLERAFKQVGCSVVRIDGSVVGTERELAIAAFKDISPDAPRVLVAHPRTMGTGQNLAQANEMLFYSNPLSSILRTQSEDRIDRIGQTRTVTIADFVARDAPIDRIILDLHTKKSTMNQQISTGRFQRPQQSAAEIRKELELPC